MIDNNMSNNMQLKNEIPLVSIIVAFYNPGDFLIECIASIVDQYFSNFEVLLINDGSTDGSESIGKDIENRDNRFRYYFQENKGVSAARNFGLKLSRGKYITFVDADDCLCKDHIQTLVKNIEIENASLSCVRWKRSDTEDKAIIDSQGVLNLIDKNEMFKGLFDSSLYAGYVWNKLYLKSLLDNNHIIFDENICVLEDQLFNVQYMTKCSSVVFCYQETYYYRIHPQSAMQQHYNLSKTTSLDASLQILSILKTQDVDEDLLGKRTIHTIHIYRNNLKFFTRCKKWNELKIIISELKQFIRTNRVPLSEILKSYMLIGYSRLEYRKNV